MQLPACNVQRSFVAHVVEAERAFILNMLARAFGGFAADSGE